MLSCSQIEASAKHCLLHQNLTWKGKMHLCFKDKCHTQTDKSTATDSLLQLLQYSTILVKSLWAKWIKSTITLSKLCKNGFFPTEQLKYNLHAWKNRPLKLKKKSQVLLHSVFLMFYLDGKEEFLWTSSVTHIQLHILDHSGKCCDHVQPYARTLSQQFPCNSCGDISRRKQKCQLKFELYSTSVSCAAESTQKTSVSSPMRNTWPSVYLQTHLVDFTPLVTKCCWRFNLGLSCFVVDRPMVVTSYNTIWR